MSKRRPLGSTHDALTRAIGMLTYADACEATGLSENHLRKCTDPACGRDISLRAAIAIDSALVAQGDEPVMVETFAASDSESTTLLARLRRIRFELDQAERLLQSAGDDNWTEFRAVGRELIEITRRAADLSLINQDRMMGGGGDAGA